MKSYKNYFKLAKKLINGASNVNADKKDDLYAAGIAIEELLEVIEYMSEEIESLQQHVSKIET